MNSTYIIDDRFRYTTGMKVLRLRLLWTKALSNSSLTNRTCINRWPISFMTGVNATLLRLLCNENGRRLRRCDLYGYCRLPISVPDRRKHDNFTTVIYQNCIRFLTFSFIYACQHQNRHWSHKKRYSRMPILEIFARRGVVIENIFDEISRKIKFALFIKI